MLREAMMLGAMAVAAMPPLMAQASDIPFAITGASNGRVSCLGPGAFSIPRVTGCHPFSTNKRLEFYSAEDNLFSPYGLWGCSVHPSNCDSIPQKAKVDFCVRSDNPRVELTWDGNNSLTVNQPGKCVSTLARSVLGQNGEDDDTPAQDLDTFSFAGKPGERGEVRLDIDGRYGGLGAVATLRVRTPAGAVLGQRTGPVPLSLELTLPGPVEITALRQPGDGEPFRGGYTLEVRPASGDIGDRQLRPTANVEH